MRKEVFVDEEIIKIVEYKNRFLSLEPKINEIEVPVHLIKLVQKAYTTREGTYSIAIFLETENEFYITRDELENIDSVFEQFVDLKERTNKFRVELYNVETRETIDK